MSGNKPKRAFTLIELLVVVAIIALLISVLLPSLKKAKDAARKAVCMAHLKDIGSAAHEYATEDELEFLIPISPLMVRRMNNEVHKRTVMWYSWGGRGAPEQIYDFSGNLSWVNENHNKPYFDSTRRPLTKYMYSTIGVTDRDTPVFECPADSGFPLLDPGVIDDIPEENFGRRLYDIIGNSYRGSLSQLIPGTVQVSRRFSIGAWGQPVDAIQNAAETLWGGDPLFYNLIGTDSGGGWPEVKRYGWHGDYMSEVELYCDGGARDTQVVPKDDPTWIPSESDAQKWGVDPSVLGFLTRGPGWQIDCYPSPGVAFGYNPSNPGWSWPYKGARSVPPPSGGWE